MKEELGQGYPAERSAFENPNARVFEHVVEPLIARRMAELDAFIEAQDPLRARLLNGASVAGGVTIVGTGPENLQLEFAMALLKRERIPPIILVNERYPLISPALKAVRAVFRPSLEYEPSPRAKGHLLLINNGGHFDFIGTAGTHQKDIAAAIRSAWNYSDKVTLFIQLSELWHPDGNETILEVIKREFSSGGRVGYDKKELGYYLNAIAFDLVSGIPDLKSSPADKNFLGSEYTETFTTREKRIRVFISDIPVLR